MPAQAGATDKRLLQQLRQSSRRQAISQQRKKGAPATASAAGVADGVLYQWLAMLLTDAALPAPVVDTHLAAWHHVSGDGDRDTCQAESFPNDMQRMVP